MKILIVAAHPDDEVLGCGGTVAKFIRDGHIVCLAILSGGVTSRFEQSDKTQAALVRSLRTQSREAAKRLGVQDVVHHDLPDNRFDTVPLLEVVKTVEDLIDRFSPEFVFTHHAGDLNVDHEITHRAIITATRPVRGTMVQGVYAFETPSSTEWRFGEPIRNFSPQMFVDISGTLGRKIEAMRCYSSETRPFPHPRSAQALRALAEYRGSQAGFMAAEAFEIVRELRP